VDEAGALLDLRHAGAAHELLEGVVWGGMAQLVTTPRMAIRAPPWSRLLTVAAQVVDRDEYGPLLLLRQVALNHKDEDRG